MFCKKEFGKLVRHLLVVYCIVGWDPHLVGNFSENL